VLLVKLPVSVQPLHHISNYLLTDKVLSKLQVSVFILPHLLNAPVSQNCRNKTCQYMKFPKVKTSEVIVQFTVKTHITQGQPYTITILLCMVS